MLCILHRIFFTLWDILILEYNHLIWKLLLWRYLWLLIYRNHFTTIIILIILICQFACTICTITCISWHWLLLLINLNNMFFLILNSFIWSWIESFLKIICKIHMFVRVYSMMRLLLRVVWLIISSINIIYATTCFILIERSIQSIYFRYCFKLRSSTC